MAANAACAAIGSDVYGNVVAVVDISGTSEIRSTAEMTDGGGGCFVFLLVAPVVVLVVLLPPNQEDDDGDGFEEDADVGSGNVLLLPVSRQ